MSHQTTSVWDALAKQRESVTTVCRLICAYCGDEVEPTEATPDPDMDPGDWRTYDPGWWAHSSDMTPICQPEDDSGPVGVTDGESDTRHPKPAQRR